VILPPNTASCSCTQVHERTDVAVHWVGCSHPHTSVLQLRMPGRPHVLIIARVSDALCLGAKSVIFAVFIRYTRRSYI